MDGLVSRLAFIQGNLKAPKNQNNTFGKYKYRSCEDILEAVKPFLDGLMLTLSDEMIAVGDRVYVKATAKITDGKDTIEVTANAREAVTKKGMDDSQITGTASSYARKYALNGLFCIDDSKDADTNEYQAQHNSAVSDQDMQWVNGIKSGQYKIDQIDDQGYRNHIQKLLNQGA